MYQRTEQWPPLVELYRRRLDVAESDEERVSVLHRAADVTENKLEDASGATTLYREALEISPDDGVATEALDRLLAASSQHDDLADHLRFRIDNAMGTPEEADLRFRLGELQAGELNDLSGAIDTFEEVLNIDATHAPTVAALEANVTNEDHQRRITEILEPIYRQQDEWRKLVAVLEARAGLDEDPMDTAMLLTEVARLHEDRGDDKASAFDAWSRAFATDAGTEGARENIDRIAGELDNWAGAVSAYEGAIASTEDAMTKSALLEGLAAIHDEQLGDPRAAIKVYERLADHDPENADALDMLEGLLSMVGDWDGMVGVLRRKTERSYDPAERAEYLRSAGSIHEELLNNRDAAIDAYRKATAEDEMDPMAWEALDRLYTDAKEHNELSDVLQKRIEVEEDDESRIEIGLRLATLEEKQLKRPERAIDALLAVQAAEPTHPEALKGLAKLYQSEERWPELLEILATQKDEAEELTDKVALLERAGRVLERELDDSLEAIERYREALSIDSTHDASLEGLTRIAKNEDYREQAAEILEPLLREGEKHDGLAELLALRVETTGDPMDRKELLLQLADTHEQGRENPGDAFEAYRAALGEDPEDAAVQDNIERLAESLGKWEDAADAFSNKAGAAMDPSVGKALFLRTARIAEDNLSDNARAVSSVERALDLVGDEPELLERLDGLHEKMENWSAVGEVLDRRVAAADDPDTRVELLLRLGGLRKERFDDARGAFQAYQEIVEDRPEEERALDGLMSLTEDKDLAPEIVDVLDNAYRSTDRNDKILELYDVRISLADSDGEKMQMLQEAAQIWEQDLGDAGKAFDSMRRAFELDPRDMDALSEVERLAEASGQWEGLRGVVERVSEGDDTDSVMLRDLNLRAAAWYRDHLADNAAAEARLRACLSADPDTLEAHEQLVDILRAGEPAALIPALRAFAAVDSDSDANRERLREAATLALELPTPEGDEASAAESPIEVAAACLEGVLELDPGDPDALERLAEIRTTQEQWPAVVDLLAKRVDGESDGGARMELRRRLAGLYAEKLSDAAKATETYETMLEEDPNDIETIGALEPLYEGDERWDDLRGLIETRLELAESDADRIAARVRMARLQEQAFGARDEALAQLEGILEIDPRNAEALDEMERLLGLDEKWDEVAALLDRRAGDEGDEAARIDLLTRLAELHADKRDAKDDAVGVYERIVGDKSDHEPTLRALVAIHEDANDHAAVADALDRLIPVLEDEEALATTLRIAELAEKELEDQDRAEAMLRAAVDRDGSTGDEGARGMLRAHLERHEKWEALAGMLDEELQTIPEDEKEAQGEMLKNIAALYTDKLDDPGTGATYFERAVELTPDDREVLLPLCDLYIAAGRQSDAVPVLEKIIESFGTRRNKELATYHHRLGKAMEGMGDADGALEHYDSAFKIDLTNVAILRDLGMLTHSRGDWDRAQKTFRALLLQKLKPEHQLTKADVYFYLGDISSNLGEKPKAKSMLDRAIAEDPNHERAKALRESL